MREAFEKTGAKIPRKTGNFVNVDKNAIMDSSNGGGESSVNRVHHVCNLDKDIYKVVAKDISTDEVIITDERVSHIKNRHPNDYEKYKDYMIQAIQNPNYIIEANRPNTAVILKKIEYDGKEFKVVMKIKTSTDPKNYKNSVITFMKIDSKEWSRLVRNKKILYKSGDKI